MKTISGLEKMSKANSVWTTGDEENAKQFYIGSLEGFHQEGDIWECICERGS